MSKLRPSPRLWVKTLAVTFGTVALLLLIVFVVVTVSVRDEVRRDVTTNLESSERMFASLEMRQQRELRDHATMLVEDATLIAALHALDVEQSTGDGLSRARMLVAIGRELDKVDAHVESDAIVIVDARQHILAAAGRLADRWPRGGSVPLLEAKHSDAFDAIVQMSDTVFRVVAVPLLRRNVAIGTLYLATSLDQQYANALAELAGTQAVILIGRVPLVSTLPLEISREFGGAVATGRLVAGRIDLAGESHAFRRLVDVGEASFYALGSIDESSRPINRSVLHSLAVIGIGATALALGASLWLARMISEPVGQLSTSMARMAASHDVDGRLLLTRSSRELDTLTDTFNDLMASVSIAEAQTEAACAGAIRALAVALDARDPYTAGHSERVSVLSVAIGRILKLSNEELEVLRLGALLHDIGKIGVPDEVLLKPGALTPREFDIIKEHPALGARILRSVPFLAPHIPIVELHHERPDGKGYPLGLRSDDIPLHARIVHVADAYDAMTSARAYRRSRASAEALRELWRCVGTEFHEDVVGALATTLPGIAVDL